MISIISYIVVIAITMFFTYIFDVRENYVVLYMLIIAPIFDYLIFQYQKKLVTVNLKVRDENLEKKQDTEIVISINNGGMFPISNLEYELIVNKKLYTGEYLKERVSVAAKNHLEREINIQAIHRGVAEVEISSVNIKSMLGLFKSNISLDDSTLKRISITPALVDLDGVEAMLDETTSYESSEDASNYMYAGEPGYEFREYVEGDPLSKVNWKISAKRNVLMIRKSSSMVRHKKYIVLDSQIPLGAYYEEKSDLFIETLIAMAKEFFVLDYDVNVIYKSDNDWVSIPFDKIDVIAMLQNIFSYYDFSNYNSKEERFNNLKLNNEEVADYVLISGNDDAELMNFITSFQDENNSVTLISDYRNKIAESQYYLNRDYTVERL